MDVYETTKVLRCFTALPYIWALWRAPAFCTVCRDARFGSGAAEGIAACERERLF